jgi:AraC-like DNA-binding protein
MIGASASLGPAGRKKTRSHMGMFEGAFAARLTVLARDAGGSVRLHEMRLRTPPPPGRVAPPVWPLSPRDADLCARLIRRLAPQLADLARDRELAAALTAMSADALARLLQDCIRAALETTPAAEPEHNTPTTGGLAPWQLRRVTDFLERNLARPVSLVDIARIARLSQFHFARAFKRSTGRSPHAYLVSLRIRRAKELLATTKQSITEIAGAVGYDTPQSLARVFTRDVGVTPSEYRRTHACW